MRVLSAAILAPVVLACLWFGGWPFRVLMLFGAFGLAFEWLAISDCKPGTPPTGPFLIGATGSAICVAFGFAIFALPLVVAGAAGAWVLGPARTRRWLAMGVVYIGLGVTALLWLREDPDAGRTNLLFVLLLVWASDIGAYMVGRLAGGPRLAPRISPGKTWSGAIGGLLVAVAMATVASWLTHRPSSMAWMVVVAVSLGIVAQAGDLFESLVKRHFGVKDSGQIIPGHGGLLDRLDALLAAAPVAAAMALASGRGVVLWA